MALSRCQRYQSVSKKIRSFVKSGNFRGARKFRFFRIQLVAGSRYAHTWRHVCLAARDHAATAVTLPGCDIGASNVRSASKKNTQALTAPVPRVRTEQAINRRGDSQADEVFAHDYAIFAAARTPPKSFGAGGVGRHARVSDLPYTFGFPVCAAVRAQYARRIHDAARRPQHAGPAH